jgi:hypothetical protein
VSVLLLDQRAHADAIKAAVTAAMAPKWSAYDFGGVPGFDDNTGDQPNLFALISVDLIPGSNQRMSAQTGVTRWRVGIRGVGRTVDEVRWVLFKAAGVLHEKSLTVDERLTTPLQSEPGQAPSKDAEGRYSGLSTYTYTH